jgi:hypothetical protein
MAFCNVCGANLEGSANFCPKCGAAQQPGSTIGGTVAATGSATPAGRGQARNRVFVVLAAVLSVGLLILITLVAFVAHIAHRTRVENRNGQVRIESPFGSVESTNDPAAAARALGVDVYPDARLLKGNAANVDVAGMHTVAAQFETDDSADKVADFYKSKLPNATVNSSGGNYSIVSNETNNLVTIKIEPQGGKTLIKVANISGKGVGGSSSD